MQRRVTFNTSKISDCLDQEGRKLASFTIRTTDGTDEVYAAKRADSKGSSMTEELIRFSMVTYSVIDVTLKGNELPAPLEITISHPFEAFEKWSTKARNLVVAAWKKLATPDDGELADFFASATEAA